VGKSNGDLNAHHKKAFIQIIKSNKIETIEEAENCKELWDVENGITLCKRCHQKEHKIKKRERKVCGIYRI
jgi:hypothetical protein